LIKTGVDFLAVLELTALAIVAWLIAIYVFPDGWQPNVRGHGLKWFWLTFLSAALQNVLIPVIPLFAVGAVFLRWVIRKPNYWLAYRIAFIVALFYTGFGNYFIWYGNCLQHNSVKHCGIFNALFPAEVVRANKKTNVSIPSQQKTQIVAAITTQNAEGVTSSDLDQEGLLKLEAWFVQTILQKSEERITKQGYAPKIRANSVFIDIQGNRLAVIKIRMAGIRSVMVVGVKGNNLLRVTCIRKDDHDIPLFSGECGNKMNEAFDVAVQP
jgi:hypothetical protein